MLRLLRIALLSTILALGTSTHSYAIFASGSIVHDPGVMGQALLSVKTGYDQYAAQLRDYAQQLQQYKEMLTHTVQGAQNLARTPLHIIGEVDALYQEYQTTMQTAQGLGYQVANARAQFEALYNGQNSYTSAALVAKIRQMAAQQRRADAEAARMQDLRKRHDATQAQMRRALEAARAAEGNLAVQQSAVQLQAVIATHQQQTAEMIAASLNAQTSYQAMQTTLQQIATDDAQRAMAGWSDCPSCGTALRTFPAFR